MAKKAIKRTVAKAGKNKKGARYGCNVCGMVVTVDNVCGCVDTCDIVCCGEEMIAKH